MGKKLALKSKKGFTLVEIIVVLVILAILAAIAIPTYLGYVSKAKDQQIKTEAREVYVAAQAYASEQYAVVTTDADTAIGNALKGSGACTSTGIVGKLVGESLSGSITAITVTDGKIIGFTYQLNGSTKTCTYDSTVTSGDKYTIGTAAASTSST